MIGSANPATVITMRSYAPDLFPGLLEAAEHDRPGTKARFSFLKKEYKRGGDLLLLIMAHAGSHDKKFKSQDGHGRGLLADAVLAVAPILNISIVVDTEDAEDEGRPGRNRPREAIANRVGRLLKGGINGLGVRGEIGLLPRGIYYLLAQSSPFKEYLASVNARPPELIDIFPQLRGAGIVVATRPQKLRKRPADAEIDGAHPGA